MIIAKQPHPTFLMRLHSRQTRHASEFIRPESLITYIISKRLPEDKVSKSSNNKDTTIRDRGEQKTSCRIKCAKTCLDLQSESVRKSVRA